MDVLVLEHEDLGRVQIARTRLENKPFRLHLSREAEVEVCAWAQRAGEVKVPDLLRGSVNK